jgi:hypothetical protein
MSNWSPPIFDAGLQGLLCAYSCARDLGEVIEHYREVGRRIDAPL